MANTVIQLKHSTLTGNVPSSLANGEISINSRDGKFFYSTPAGVVVTHYPYPGPAGLNQEVQFNDSGVLGSDSGLTYNKTTDVLTVVGGAIVGGVNVTPQIQLAFTQANTPSHVANSAASYANSAFLVANTPTHVANSAASYANSGFAVANSGASYANSAFTVANNAVTSTNGSIAWATANSAASYANSAFSAANGANATDATQNTNITNVGTYANAGFAVANSAASYANSAFTKANTASGASASGYLANTIIFANTTGFLSNTANLQFFTSNNTIVVANSAVATIGDAMALAIALG